MEITKTVREWNIGEARIRWSAVFCRVHCRRVGANGPDPIGIGDRCFTH